MRKKKNIPMEAGDAAASQVVLVFVLVSDHFCRLEKLNNQVTSSVESDFRHVDVLAMEVRDGHVEDPRL